MLSAWGVGGGTLLLLFMTLILGFDPRTAQTINLLYFLPTAAMALIQHAKNGYLDRTTLKDTVPPAVVSALLCAFLALSVDVSLLRRPFGVFLLISATILLRQEFQAHKQKKT